MKSIIADRINTKVIAAERELAIFKAHEKELEKALERSKSLVHHDEYEILRDGTSEGASNAKSYKFFADLKDLRHDQNALHVIEKELKDTNIQIGSLTKEIERLRFWRDRADTTDEAHQREAEYKIFG